MFRTWQRDEVTKVFFETLKEWQGSVQEELTLPEVLLGDQKIVASLLGELRLLKVLLNIELGDIQVEEKDGDGDRP